LNGLFNFLEKIHENGAFSHPQFRAQQIHGLNAVGAFINAGDFAVAVKLSDGIFPGLSITAIYLNGQSADILSLVNAV
jgi:hypothetical protein